MLCLLNMSLSTPGYGVLSQRRSADVTFASDDTHAYVTLASDDTHTDVTVAKDDIHTRDDIPPQALHLSDPPQTRHLSKRSLTFSIFVDNLRFQPQLFTGLGAQVFAVG